MSEGEEIKNGNADPRDQKLRDLRVLLDQNDLRHHLSEGASEAARKQVEEENAALRRSLHLMHRRCQLNEGAAIRLERIKAANANGLRSAQNTSDYWREKCHRYGREKDHAQLKLQSYLTRSFWEQVADAFRSLFE